jgi:hypothetical protein
MNKYWKFQGKIITLSCFLSAPKKGYNLCTLGPQRTFAEKWWALKVLTVEGKHNSCLELKLCFSHISPRSLINNPFPQFSQSFFDLSRARRKKFRFHPTAGIDKLMLLNMFLWNNMLMRLSCLCCYDVASFALTKADGFIKLVEWQVPWLKIFLDDCINAVLLPFLNLCC